MSDTNAKEAGVIKIGSTSVNRFGLGTNRIHDDQTGKTLLAKALELGINFIDTAHIYAGGDSEVAIGNNLAELHESKSLVIATKGGMGSGASPHQLRVELEESLHRLKTNRIDLYQLHRVDPKTPLQESMRALKQFQDEGLIKYAGLSEVNVDQIEEASTIIKVVSIQNEYNIVSRQHEDLVDYCQSHDIVFIPWFPLGGLAGDAEKVNKRLKDLSAKYEASPQQISLAWLLKRSTCILPIPGTLSADHLADNLKAASLNLSEEDYLSL
jgi:pyridoxine 4-dehydrogenase